MLEGLQAGEELEGGRHQIMCGCVDPPTCSSEGDIRLLRFVRGEILGVQPGTAPSPFCALTFERPSPHPYLPPSLAAKCCGSTSLRPSCRRSRRRAQRRLQPAAAAGSSRRRCARCAWTGCWRRCRRALLGSVAAVNVDWPLQLAKSCPPQQQLRNCGATAVCTQNGISCRETNRKCNLPFCAQVLRDCKHFIKVGSGARLGELPSPPGTLRLLCHLALGNAPAVDHSGER